MKKLSLISVFVLVLGWIGVSFSANTPPSDEKLKTSIEQACSKYLQRKLTIGYIHRAGFPRLDTIAKDIRVEDKDGTPIIECPEAVIQVSAFSLLWLTLTLDEIRFIKPVVYLRMDRKGQSNIRDVVKDARDAPKKKSKGIVSLSYNRFVIENGVLEVLERDTNRRLLPGQVIVNGKGDVRRALPGKKFLFEIAPKLSSDPNAEVAIKGTLSRSPVIYGLARNIRGELLAGYIPSFADCKGTFDLDLWWKRPKGKSMWRAEFHPKDLCANEPIVFPTAAMEYDGSAKPAELNGLLDSKQSKVVIQARFPSEHQTFTSISVKGAMVNVMEMFAWERGLRRTLEFRTRKSTGTWKTVVHVDVSTAMIKGQAINQLWCKIDRSTSALTTINLSSASAFGGQILGDLYVSTPHVMMSLYGNDIQADRVFSMFTSSNIPTGKGTVEAKLTSLIGPDFLNTAEGKIVVNMKDGTLPNSPTILNILSSANVRTLINHLKGKRGKDDIPVDTAYANIQIINGKALASEDDPWVVENEVMQAGFIGTVDYVNNKIDGRVVLQVLTVPDEIIGLVPGLKFLLFGDKRSFFPISIKIQGPFENPTTKVQSLRTITAPVWNTIGRAFRLPKDLIDVIRGKD